MQVLHRLFRIAFDDRIGRLPDSLVLPVKAHLQVVIFMTLSMSLSRIRAMLCCG